jgi:hypothetical protein
MSSRELPFGQRHGFEPVKAVQVENMDVRLRNALWNCVYAALKWVRPSQFSGFSDSSVFQFYLRIWDEVLGARSDKVSSSQYNARDELGAWFQKAPWFKVYELVEFIARNHDAHDFVSCCTEALERESSGYRFLQGKLVPIVSSEELAEVESAITSESGPVSTHLRAAVRALADRSHQNPRKVVHESISAVESAVRSLLGDEKVTLGDGLKRVNLDLHPALSKGLGVLYGWTSDAKSGIRHGLSDKPWEVDGADARYMLIACSAFVNYLRAKSGKELP